MNEDYGSTMNVIYDGTKRAELLFGKHSITHQLYRNIKAINAADANEGELYQKWLLDTKIPELKSDIEGALIDEFMKTGDMEGLNAYVDKFNAKLDKFRELCRKEYNELEFLKSYA
jgi:hypothetical protein